jgi:3-hydroxyacyl-CoA dehydrogenase
MPEGFQRDFLITHFFNPPRYMRLLEVVRSDQTSAEGLARITDFADRALGKTVIECKDTPGFIANRIGCYWIQAAFKHAFEAGLAVEEADAVMGRSLGIPKTGVFGLADLVGIDLLPHVAMSLRAALRPDDAFHDVDRDWPLIKEMIDSGYTGRKGKGGFYRLNTAGGGRVKEAIDLQSGSYHTARKPRIGALDAARSRGVRALFEGDEPAARLRGFASPRDCRRHCSRRSCHAPRLQHEVGAV